MTKRKYPSDSSVQGQQSRKRMIITFTSSLVWVFRSLSGIKHIIAARKENPIQCRRKLRLCTMKIIAFSRLVTVFQRIRSLTYLSGIKHRIAALEENPIQPRGAALRHVAEHIWITGELRAMGSRYPETVAAIRELDSWKRLDQVVFMNQSREYDIEGEDRVVRRKSFNSSNKYSIETRLKKLVTSLTGKRPATFPSVWYLEKNAQKPIFDSLFACLVRTGDQGLLVKLLTSHNILCLDDMSTWPRYMATYRSVVERAMQDQRWIDLLRFLLYALDGQQYILPVLKSISQNHDEWFEGLMSHQDSAEILLALQELVRIGYVKPTDAGIGAHPKLTGGLQRWMHRVQRYIDVREQYPRSFGIVPLGTIVQRMDCLFRMIEDLTPGQRTALQTAQKRLHAGVARYGTETPDVVDHRTSGSTVRVLGSRERRQLYAIKDVDKFCAEVEARYQRKLAVLLDTHPDPKYVLDNGDSDCSTTSESEDSDSLP